MIGRAPFTMSICRPLTSTAPNISWGEIGPERTLLSYFDKQS